MQKIFLIILLLFSNSILANEPIIPIELSEQEQQEKIAQKKARKIQIDNLKDLIARGEANLKEKNFDTALEKFLSSLPLAKNLNLNHSQVKILTNIASIYYHKNNIDESLKYYYEALEIAEKIKHNLKKYAGFDLAYIYSRIAYSNFNKDNNLAKNFLEKAILENKSKKNNNALLENYYNIILICKKLGLLDDAKLYKAAYKKLSKKQNISVNFFKLEENNIKYDYLYKISPTLIAEEEESLFDEEGKLIKKLIVKTNKKLTKTAFSEILILNKINGFTYSYEVPIGSKVKVKDLEVLVRNCFKANSQDLPENYAFLTILDGGKQKFNGWSFAENPSKNPFEHPIYDVKLVNCYSKNI